MTSLTNESIYKTLKDLRIISDADLEGAYKASKLNNILLYDVLHARDLLNQEHLAQVVAETLGVPYIKITDLKIPSETLNLVPETVAKTQGVIAIKQDDKSITLATDYLRDNQIIEFFSRKTKKEIQVVITGKKDLQEALTQYTTDIQSKFNLILEESLKEHSKDKSAQEPILAIEKYLIEYAFQSQASDIHIEPTDDSSLIRYRVDGLLRDIAKLPPSFYEQLISRIKVRSKLRIDEHSEAQDGKFIHQTENGEEIDIRVSIMPAVSGEKAVLRLLAETSRDFGFDTLGLSEANQKELKKAYEHPNGLIVVAGPTGSGKTTTLYSIIKRLNRREVNISTIEDPVEYKIDGITQIQVNPKTKLTFASGLRSIVRQDPDIILVGEIRDTETANIAVNAAMTGHLVLTTMHTNDAATTIPRLVDIGVEPFLIASTLKAIASQRLIRTIHRSCRSSSEVEVNSLPKPVQIAIQKNKKSAKIRTYTGKGCPACSESGYKDRVGIFEVMTINEDLQQAIIERKSSQEINKIAEKNGMKPLIADGIKKVLEGITSLDEVLRVTQN